MDLKTFVGLWNDGDESFKADPPNAELAIHKADGDTHTVLIINTPSVNGDTVSFEVSKIDDEMIPPSFMHSTLFIDGYDVSVTNNSNSSGGIGIFSKP